jgi:predicted component of type VI protein secretion system
MKLSLVVLNAGKSAGQVIPINLAQFVIGRDAQCNLRPGSALISKRHCAVIVKNGDVFVRDFDSTNGTFINDQPLKGETAVKHDDILKAGPLEFRIAIEEAPAIPPSKTPTPTAGSPKKLTPPAPTKGTAQGESNEDVAALLLGLDDDEMGTKDDMGIPDGSTVMDVPMSVGHAVAAETVIADAATANSDAAKAATEKKKKVHEIGSAQSAAQAILNKFKQRSR